MRRQERARSAGSEIPHRLKPVPYEQDNHRAYRRSDEASPLIGAVPADRLTDECRKECSDYAEQGGEDESGRIVRPRREEARNNARDKTDHNNPKDAHFQTPLTATSPSPRRLDFAISQTRIPRGSHRCRRSNHLLRFLLGRHSPVGRQLIDDVGQLLAESLQQVVAGHSGIGHQRVDPVGAQRVREVL